MAAASQINKVQVFCEEFAEGIPSEVPITELLARLDGRARDTFGDVSGGALSNAHGSWYEYLLSIAAWNSHKRHAQPVLMFRIPNVSQFDGYRLYRPELFDMIEHLRREVAEQAEIRLVTSNPDLVGVRVGCLDRLPTQLPDVIEDVTPEIIVGLEALHQQFIGKCDFGDIPVYASVKTSFRPDRRLQIAHEGSLVKALHVHLQTRLWITSPPKLQYFAISTSVGAADIEALKTVATHSVTTVSSLPQSAVDAVKTVNSYLQAQHLFTELQGC
jgi:hypothetical protein